MQISQYEKPIRDRRTGDTTEVALGLLPLSHIYGLVVVAQASTYRGDGVIILPRFEIESYLRAIQDYKIQSLYLVRFPSEPNGLRSLSQQVPPIIIGMTKNQGICKKFDLNSVRSIFTGAAPLGAETAADLQKLYPTWKIRQAYGMIQR